MEINLNDMKEKISGLSNEDIVNMLTVDRDEYTEEALEIADKEIQNRGGFELIQKQYKEKMAVQQKEQQAKQSIKKEVAKNYSFTDHVVNTWLRWGKAYGVLVIGWFILRTSQSSGHNIFKVLASGTFSVGIITLFVLSIIYAFIYSSINYKKALEELIVIKCENCKKVVVMYVDKIKMKVDENHFYNSICKHCKSPTRINLDFAFKEAEKNSEPRNGSIQKGEKKEYRDHKIEDKALSSIEIDQYLGAFKRQKWKIELMSKQAIFYNLKNPNEKITIPKKDIHEHVSLNPYGSINLKLTFGGKVLKFITLDINDFYNWMPEK